MDINDTTVALAIAYFSLACVFKLLFEMIPYVRKLPALARALIAILWPITIMYYIWS